MVSSGAQHPFRKRLSRLRQAIILRAATVLDAPYEWQANVPMSRNNGLSDAEIDAIGSKDSLDRVPEP